jgi:hypothetical protein
LQAFADITLYRIPSDHAASYQVTPLWVRSRFHGHREMA